VVTCHVGGLKSLFGAPAATSGKGGLWPGAIGNETLAPRGLPGQLNHMSTSEKKIYKLAREGAALPVAHVDTTYRSVKNMAPERRARLLMLLTDFVPRHKIIDTLTAEWGCSAQTVKRHIYAIFDEWDKDPVEGSKARRYQAIQQLYGIIELCLQKGQYNTAVSAIDKLLRVEGAYAPTRVEVKDDSKKAMDKNNPDYVRERIKLLAKHHPEYAALFQSAGASDAQEAEEEKPEEAESLTD